MPYSRIVQMTIPSTKQDSVWERACVVIFSAFAADACATARKSNALEGTGSCENCCSDREKRAAEMGSHTIGGTYHEVRVKISKYHGPKSLAGSLRWRGEWTCSK